MEITENTETEWVVTYFNANYDFSLLHPSAETIISNSAEIRENVESVIINSVKISVFSNFHQFISGTFSLSLGGYFLKIPSNATSLQFTDLLETVPFINTVGVTRDNFGLRNGFRWTVTFFAFNTYEIGKALMCFFSYNLLNYCD